jgi:flagellar basal-body rod protein FlgF
MIEGITSAARSLEKSNKGIAVVSNNLANIDTVGYKRDANFYEILGEFEQPEMKEYTDFQTGEVSLTSNPLDFALKGDAFFVVQKDDQMLYTKDGKFSVDQDGYLVNGEGNKVMGQRGAINITQNILDDNQNVTVSKSGEIKVGDVDVDSLMIAKIDDKDALQKYSSADFVLKEGYEHVQADESEYEVQQGFLESSNVNAVEEMQEMIKISKNYESAQKVVQYFDTSLEKANEIGKV